MTAAAWFLMIMTIVATEAGSAAQAPDSKERVSKLDVGPIAAQVFLPLEFTPLADVVEVSVVLTAPPGVEIAWPKPPASIADAKVLGTRTDGPDPAGRFLMRRWTLRVEPLKLGSMNLGSASIRYRDAGSEWASGEIPLGKTTIVAGPSSSTDVTTLRPIPALEPEPTNPWPRLLVWGGVSLGATAVLAFVWHSLREKPSPAVEAAGAPDRWLLLEKAVESGPASPRELVHAANELFREQFDARFGGKSTCQSSAELLADVDEDERWPLEHRAALEEFLAWADVERFGRREPTMDEVKTYIRRAKALLQKESLQ